jgi:hypothetical protein
MTFHPAIFTSQQQQNCIVHHRESEAFEESALKQFAFGIGLMFLLPVCWSQTPAGWTTLQNRQNVIYQPTGLPTEKSFTMTVESAQDLNGQSPSQWLTQHAEADIAQRGTVVNRGNPNAANGSWTMVDAYRDPSGQQWIVLYAAVLRQNGQAQFSSMVSNLPIAQMTPYIRAGATMLGQMARVANNGATGTIGQQSLPNAARSSGSAQPQRQRPEPKEEQMKRAVRVAQPGTGITESQIEAVLHEGRGVSTVGGYQYQESADLLLKDGWEYSSLEVPPEDLNVQVSKQLQPDQWHRWRRQGSNYYIQDQKTGQWTKLDAQAIIPLQSSINQHLLYRHSVGFGGMGSYNTRNDITFHSDGSFERSASVLAGSGVVQAAGGFSAGASSYHDRNGCSSTSAGTYTGSGATVGAYSTSHCRPGQDPNSYGGYKVSGYVLELDSASGQVQRLLAFHPFANKPDVYIDGVTFYPPN